MYIGVSPFYHFAEEPTTSIRRSLQTLHLMPSHRNINYNGTQTSISHIIHVSIEQKKSMQKRENEQVLWIGFFPNRSQFTIKSIEWNKWRKKKEIFVWKLLTIYFTHTSHARKSPLIYENIIIVSVCSFYCQDELLDRDFGNKDAIRFSLSVSQFQQNIQCNMHVNKQFAFENFETFREKTVEKQYANRTISKAHFTHSTQMIFKSIITQMRYRTLSMRK